MDVWREMTRAGLILQHIPWFMIIHDDLQDLCLWLIPRRRLALQTLKAGNERFVVGAPAAGKVHHSMREALATKGQAPHTAIVGCADSRCPLETLFDALPGDLFVLRNAGNTCTHAEGSILGSLEFCTGALNTQLIFVLGHTNCGAIKGATAAYFAATKQPTKAT